MQKLRRIVTGENAEGQSRIVADEWISPFSRAGIDLFPLWGVAELPVKMPLTGLENAENAQGLGVVRTAVGVLPPNKLVGSDDDGSIVFDSEGFHQTDSVDIAFVVSGTVTLSVPGEPDTDVHAGESIVQNGALHAWRNLTDKDVVILWVWIKGDRKPVSQ